MCHPAGSWRIRAPATVADCIRGRSRGRPASGHQALVSTCSPAAGGDALDLLARDQMPSRAEIPSGGGARGRPGGATNASANGSGFIANASHFTPQICPGRRGRIAPFALPLGPHIFAPRPPLQTNRQLPTDRPTDRPTGPAGANRCDRRTNARKNKAGGPRVRRNKMGGRVEAAAAAAAINLRAPKRAGRARQTGRSCRRAGGAQGSRKCKCKCDMRMLPAASFQMDCRCSQFEAAARASTTFQIH